jgi:hypothetical protein
MGNLVLAGATSGSTTITPTDAVTVTCTLPSTGGTLQTSGSGFTTNGVAYASSTSALATGSALTFDGQTLQNLRTDPVFILNDSATSNTALRMLSSGGIVYVQSGISGGTFAPIAFTNNGGSSELMRLNSTGLGIGTSSPAAKLDLTGNSANSGAAFQITNKSQTTQYLTMFMEGASGDGQTDWTNSAIIEAYQPTATTGTKALYLSAYNGPMIFATNARTQAMRIDSSGNLLVGQTTPSNTAYGSYQSQTGQLALITKTGTSQCLFLNRQDDAGNAILFRQANNTVGSISVTASTTAYNTSSDYRLKNTITPMTGALAKVAALKPVTYKWNVDGSDGEGFIAHELSEVCSHAVTGEKDAVDAEGKPVYQGIDTSFLVATLTAAIQELSAQVTTLTTRLTTLENK